MATKTPTKIDIKEEKFLKIFLDTGNPAEAARGVFNIGSRGGSGTKLQESRTASALGRRMLDIVRKKHKLQDLVETFKIDKKSRLIRLAGIFHESGSREAIQANQEIAKMLGDYEPQKVALGRYKEEMEEITT